MTDLALSEKPPRAPLVERFVATTQSCINVLFERPDALNQWLLFDELLTRFDSLAENEVLPLVAQVIDQAGAPLIARMLARRATERFGDSAYAWYLYGRSLLLISANAKEAGPLLERAWALDPDADPLLPLCRAAVFIAGKRFVEAEQACRYMLERQPNSADAYSNLGVALRMQYRSAEAVKACEAALRLNPDHSHAHVNLALALIDDWRFDDALAFLRRMVEQHPDDDRLRLPLGELELRLGQWSTGWAHMHARFSLPGLRDQLYAREHDCGVPQWRGESLEGRTLGVWLEQGYGDAIWLARFLPMIAERVRAEGGKLVFGCFAPLEDLFRPLIPDDVVLNVDFLAPTDYHIPLMSCGALFGFANDSLPGRPYLNAGPQRVGHWRKKLGVGDGKLHVALAWTGNPAQARNAARSLPVLKLEKLLAMENVVFHSVNPDCSEVATILRQKGLNVVDWSAELKNFITTAALLQAADCVVTTCTSVAHLAGAVGAPTILMLDRVGSFVWGCEQESSPWYDSIRIIRQKRFGDWRDVVDRTRAALAARQGAPDGAPPPSKTKRKTKGSQAAPDAKPSTPAKRRAVKRVKDAPPAE